MIWIYHYICDGYDTCDNWRLTMSSSTTNTDSVSFSVRSSYFIVYICTPVVVQLYISNSPVLLIYPHIVNFSFVHLWLFRSHKGFQRKIYVPCFFFYFVMCFITSGIKALDLKPQMLPRRINLLSWGGTYAALSRHQGGGALARHPGGTQRRRLQGKDSIWTT